MYIGVRLYVCVFEGCQRNQSGKSVKERALGMEGRREERGSGMEKKGRECEDEMRGKINSYAVRSEGGKQ